MIKTYKSTKKILWIFLHLPKTGGTTFQGHLSKHLEFDEAFYTFSQWGEKFRTKNKRLPFEKRSSSEKKKAIVLSGHETFYGMHRDFENREPRYLTFIREPAKRCISIYNFKKSVGKIHFDFPEWYSTYLTSNRNAMVEFYARRLMQINFQHIGKKELSIAKKMLDLCWYTGITDRLDSQLSFIFKEIGIHETYKNRRIAGKNENSVKGLKNFYKEKEYIKKFISLDQNLREKINRDNDLDFQLYRYGLKKNDHFIEKYNIKE